MKHFAKRLLAVCSLCLACFGTSTVLAATIVFVPQDNRPVSYAYTVDTATAAGYRVLTPPEAYLSDNSYHGSPEEIWNWLLAEAPQADALILSTDTLIYGGLVDSRKHQIDRLTLQNRLRQLQELHRTHPRLPIYAFGTIMRSPRASDGKVEPFYYAKYGPKIFEIAYWQDKRDTEGLNAEEAAKLLSLTMSVPLEYLQDWFDRRAKNNMVNERLIELAADGTLTYFCLGHDDTAGFSQSSLESRYLQRHSKSLPASRYGSFPGADQLGLLLIARYHVDRMGTAPTFAVLYPLGGAEDTMPHYENQSIGKTVADHIHAVGGRLVTDKRPDILLAINTPLGSTTGESEAFANFEMPRKSAEVFVNRVREALDLGIPTAIADVFYSNGADNGLLKEMQKADLLYRLASYNGWNTASNTVGYTVAQSILAPAMSDSAHRRMLTEQYLDNWGYQANIRKQIYREQESIRTDNVKYSGRLNPCLQEMLIESVQNFAETKLGADPRTVSARFPWERLFEAQIFVSEQPQYPLMRDIIAERKAKEEAERKARAETEGKATPANAAADSPAAAGADMPAAAADTVAAEPTAEQPEEASPEADTPAVAPAVFNPAATN
ncbi:MAG: DUF4127 family protein [Veillonellaceae bacterium]|nr:DUF4127 family protein [Veillonellaceae bacterium]